MQRTFRQQCLYKDHENSIYRLKTEGVTEDHSKKKKNLKTVITNTY